MKLVKPSISLIWMTHQPLKTIEVAGRTCYKSEDKITENSAEKFVQKLLYSGHEAMIEHASASYRVICDRGVTHEIVRHRLFSYAQESTRYCNYKGGVTFIIPCWLSEQLKYLNVVESATDFEYYIDEFKDLSTETIFWLHDCGFTEIKYQTAINNLGWTPQKARSVLTNSLKTEIVITGNLREWRHFFKLRCTPIRIKEEEKLDGIYYGANAPHPQMQEVANMLLEDIQKRIPVLFESF